MCPTRLSGTLPCANEVDDTWQMKLPILRGVSRVYGRRTYKERMMALRKETDLLVEIYETTRRRDEADMHRRELIKAALDSGISATRIAEMAGISKQGIYAYRNK